MPIWIPFVAVAGLVAYLGSGARNHAHSSDRDRDRDRERERDRGRGAPVPTPIEVFNAFLREGKAPPRSICELAVAEARAAGITDLAADIERNFSQGLPAKAGPSGETREAQTSSAPPPRTNGKAAPISVGRTAPTDSALIGVPPGHMPASSPTQGGGLLPDLMSAITGQSAKATSPFPMTIQNEDGNRSEDGNGIGIGNGNGNGAESGSPIPGVSNSQWDALRTVLAREPSSYDSERHIGRYRQSKQRLAQLRIDPARIANDLAAQDEALEIDLRDAYDHLAKSRVLDRTVGRPIVLPDMDEAPIVTIPGLLGVCAASGLEGCASWLRSKTDRLRFRHTTNLFLRCNAAGLS